MNELNGHIAYLLKLRDETRDIEVALRVSGQLLTALQMKLAYQKQNEYGSWPRPIAYFNNDSTSGKPQ